MVVTRSARHLFVQVVDDCDRTTLASASTFKLTDGDKTARAKRGRRDAGRRGEGGRHQPVVFDRGGNTYTGRIAAFADAAREGGLEF